MGQKKTADLRFKLFGTVSFTATTKINDFMDHLQKGRVTGTRCKDCNKVYFPPRADCCHCFASNMQWFDVSGSGILVAYSKLSYAPVGFDEDLPYSLAVLDYGDYKIFGRIADGITEDELHIGLKMHTKVNQLPNGQLNYVFQKFVK